MLKKSMQELATEVSERIQRAFGDRASDMTIYDVVEVPNHQMFSIKFKAYDYYEAHFGYELSFTDFYIVISKGIGISLPKEKYDFGSITNWDSYLKEIMAEIELRIPDEFLQAKGWL
ncbi:hypothetical protein [Streptococcus sp. HPH0090]|uniref:hypothetical protein n=1 Tax=Streptococcus sp. HPH0090 TaxID=1203590 RepID=UPI00034E55D0|nr:hypothetical protein [Streptococcus sp. HPH0090]EPD86144.1 hypothetical protein HMPREF1481_01226 [Streptococcus sp. HPH0090]